MPASIDYSMQLVVSTSPMTTIFKRKLADILNDFLFQQFKRRIHIQPFMQAHNNSNSLSH